MSQILYRLKNYLLNLFSSKQERPNSHSVELGSSLEPREDTVDDSDCSAKKPSINIAMLGHVDHGKSTLIGRLLFETGEVPSRTIESYREEAKSRGQEGFEFSYVLDHHSEERIRGVTINPAQRMFETEKFHFTIVDCPGHADFIENMITGTSQAHKIILVIAADEGIKPQTREHIFLARTIRLKDGICVINKMDKVGYDKEVFEDIANEVKELLDQVAINSEEFTVLPASAYEGANITASESIDWFNGPTLLEGLNRFDEPEPPTDAPLRLPVRRVYDVPEVGEIQAGCIETGNLSEGDHVTFQPSGETGVVESIEIDNQPVKEASPGDIVGVNISGVDNEIISRGEVCGPAEYPPSVAEEFTAQVVIMQHPSIVTTGYTPVFHINTDKVACKIELETKIDPSTGKPIEENPEFLQSGDAGIITVTPRRCISLEPSAKIPEMGAFSIRDHGQTIAAGRVINIES